MGKTRTHLRPNAIPEKKWYLFPQQRLFSRSGSRSLWDGVKKEAVGARPAISRQSLSHALFRTRTKVRSKSLWALKIVTWSGFRTDSFWIQPERALCTICEAVSDGFLSCGAQRTWSTATPIVLDCQQPSNNTNIDGTQVGEDLLFQDTAPLVLPSGVHAGLVSNASARILKGYFATIRRSLRFPFNSIAGGKTRGVNALLQAIHVAKKHRTHVFMTRAGVLNISDLVWICDSRSALQEARVSAGMSSEKCWK